MDMTFDGKWRLIDTAPKDTPVLVCRFVNNEWHMCESQLYYDAGSEVNNEPGEGWVWACDDDSFGVTMDEGPSHWMPRPPFPVDEPAAPPVASDNMIDFEVEGGVGHRVSSEILSWIAEKKDRNLVVSEVTGGAAGNERTSNNAEVP